MSRYQGVQEQVRSLLATRLVIGATAFIGSRLNETLEHVENASVANISSG